LLLFLVTIVAQAQISIGGNVYGGGNAGDTGDATKVVVRAGDIQGAVFGGARQANVGGSAFVHIDGQNMSGDITINAVYGGNDIAGTIGTSATLPDNSLGNGKENADLSDYNAFILTTSEKKVSGEGDTTTQPYSIFIGQVYGGGNGDYTYSDKKEDNDKYDVTVSEKVWNSETEKFEMQDVVKQDVDKPELGKTCVDLYGGTFGYVYGGGNAVTVTEAVDICINNTSTVTTKANGLELNFADAGQTNGVTRLENLTDDSNLNNPNDLRLLSMGLNLSTYQPGFNFLRVFGGNNKAQMHIRPSWYLQEGSIVNLYSGGNEGKMTSPDGLLIEIPATSDITVENVFGGCRKADVFPTSDVEGTIQVETVPNLTDYFFPTDLAARVLIRGGHIKNVYGGNDISGKVYFGNAVGIYASISGSVYGGGNGAYAYTDNANLKDDTIWGDFYYAPGSNSIKALNDFRPNAENVSLRVAGASESNPTIIGGGIFVGGDCATLRPKDNNSTSKAELKIGSYVIADEVFLGNNGAKMVDPVILGRYAGNVITASQESKDFSTLDLTDTDVFAQYMDGVTMEIKPSVVFDNEKDQGDPATYIDYKSYFGSFYCGGNIGSVRYTGSNTIDFQHKVVIFNKLVGGSNTAYVNASAGLNAAYEGGLIGDPDPVTGNKLVLNLSGLKIQPMRWKRDADPAPTAYPYQLVWNTVDGNGNPTSPVFEGTGVASEADLARRFDGGNVYGGCCESGIVNGNVVINLNGTIFDREILFDEVQSDELGEEVSLYGESQDEQTTYNITTRRTGVILAQQGMDVLGKALNVFGGGKGKGTEIWGSTTVNLKKGYTFQIFGGSEKGVIGRSLESLGDDMPVGDYEFNGKHYAYDPAYSCYVNLCGDNDGVSKSANSTEGMAECEFMYGGGFEGPIVGNTVINLGKGRIFNSFAGSCNADILGHTETYIGRMVKKSDQTAYNYCEQMGYLGITKDNNGSYLVNDESYYVSGFPWIRDIVYGGNDLGGEIKGAVSFKNRVRSDVRNMVYKYDPNSADGAEVLKANAYMEFLQGRADALFGGCYGTYDYTDPKFTETVDKPGFTKPRMNNAFVNFRPSYTNENNYVGKIYGAGQGKTGEPDRDKMQNRSYVLVDVPLTMSYYDGTEVFGAGAWGGVGMGVDNTAFNADNDKGSAIIDLMRGSISAAYGASYKEGFTRRTVVNVPDGSTIQIGSIFGGGYGIDEDGYRNAKPCDAYEAIVNYGSASARANAIYGGNNNYRRTLYGKVNISAPVWQKSNSNYLATVYGAGYGVNTWSQYTEVHLLEGAKVYSVFGGGLNGKVMNKATVDKWAVANSFSLDTGGLTDTGLESGVAASNALRDDYMKADGTSAYDKFNTNVHIHQGATVGLDPITKGGYAYGGGQGTVGIDESGDVNGTTYIGLLGGTAYRDIYAAGTVGNVLNKYADLDFTASTHAYIRGGSVRNVYGGGYMGSVGKHVGEINDDPTNDISGETHVVIGIREDRVDKPAGYGYYVGVPTVQRNAYGGGEGETQKGGRGGAVYGTANLTLNNGYVFLHDTETLDSQGNKITVASTNKGDRYEEKLTDETYFDDEGRWAGTGRLEDCGNVFGGGYSDKSNVDFTNVTMWGGIVRNSLHGGAEVAAVGRGSTKESGEANETRVFEDIYKAGGTKVTMYNGHVMRNVFGGGKGYNLLGYGGANELYTDGYVFGTTQVYIHGGEIGTEEGVEVKEEGNQKTGGYGNVFGGGDIGYVYSPSIKSTKTKQKNPTGSPDHYYYYDDAGNLSEDCKVVISPYLQVRANSVTINGKTKSKYEYFETEDLNTLPKQKDSNGNWTGEWKNLFTGDYLDGQKNPDDPVERGIHIHNAVFAGGNVTNNATAFADRPTVFGNTTATLNDIYHRDFITVGTEHIGGLYGGGNRSLVNGYRELNITNYGTDYYGLKQTITIEEYRGLSNRERAYFQLEYKCTANSETQGSGESAVQGITIDGVFYKYDQRLSEEEYLKLANNVDLTVAATAKASFEPYGFCSIYAGRLLNTIQRADLCGVFGSRMVLQGAKDRVAEVGEDIPYTINRVGELSLNKQRSKITTDTGDDALHGNYFGIYSFVNYLGNMTSDVHFSDTYINAKGEEETNKSYYTYKSANHTSSDRNKGKSVNLVALASGVFLELTTEKTETNPNKKKEYGYVTGVIELDLINVKKDLVGGGFVYAKNEHRVSRYYPSKENVILSPFNKLAGNEAITYKRYRYDSTDSSDEWPDNGTAITLGHSDDDHDTGDFGDIRSWQTSGNFIHHEKRIVDDCYPTNNAYIIGSANYSEAHYWYVKGDVYIYEQKVSAYTGSANAYSKEVHLPLTITAASNGKLQLLNVKPNLYAYYTDKNGERVKIGTEGGDGKPIDKVTVNNESDTYELNDVVSWWDWHQMSARDRQYFVTQTYVNCVTVTVTENGVPKEYEPGTYVMNDFDFNEFNGKFTGGTITIKDAKGENVETVSEVFRSSNNIGHDSGYVLTFDMNSPKIWDDWYSPASGESTYTVGSDGTVTTTRWTKEEYDAAIEAAGDNPLSVQSQWHAGPTFTPTTSGVYGKRQYKIGDVVTEDTYKNAAEGKDNMERAYVAKETVSYTYNGQAKTVNPGTPISWTEYNALSNTLKASFAEAWFCKATVKLNSENYLLYGELRYEAEITQLKQTYSSLSGDIDAALTPAYICIANGEYGGQQFDTGKNYTALETWCSLSSTDRQKFNYNFDALDLLTNKEYLTVNTNVTSSPTSAVTAAAFHAPYTDEVPVEYQAVFVGGTGMTSLTLTTAENGLDKTLSTTDAMDNRTIDRTVYETIRNDKRHYTNVKTTTPGEHVYIAKNNFVYLGIPYGKGQLIDSDVYTHNTSDVEDVTIDTPGEWYYCFEAYVKKDGASVSKGTKILPADYKNDEEVPNDQQYFIIQGKEPTETTTLYVSSESNAHDVMSDKIITVVYQYTYYEDEDDGSVKMTNELHVINIHLELESGAPTIGELSPPPTVLPGSAVGLTLPNVNPGLYEVLTNGWELYTTRDDAVNHRNGVPFTNNLTPVYWYQNQKNWVAFYSKTWLGKTYSNPVPLSVANYHDLDEVMQDKKHHMYVDRSDVDRECKIYIDNRNCKSDATKSELDLLKDFFDLSLQSAKITTEGAATKDHDTLAIHVRAGRNLEFILRSDISPKAYTTWTPIGNNSIKGNTGECFQGNLHGDGYTVSGLTSSLFGHLCGEVYNLGVTGTFTGAGIAETGDGYLENCWIKTTRTPVQSAGDPHYAVFANPSRAADDPRGPVQVENCYYPMSNDYQKPTATDYAHGKPTQMDDKDFYNGTVAYNLNGFYLKKRYYDGIGLASGTTYKYLPNTDGTLPDEMVTDHYYPNTYAIYQPHVKMSEEETAPYLGTNAPYMGYVENRFYDGDYRYARSGSSDIRMRTVTTTTGEGDDAEETVTTYYVPIWPDDYIFFGQALTYGHVGNKEHQDTPSHINKDSEFIDLTANGNRVYRAPAYFRSKEMKMAHFNPYAVFAQTKKGDADVVAYKEMTAIDFTGHNDADVDNAYQYGWDDEHEHFFHPLLDDGGLTSFQNVDLTRNLLVYTLPDTKTDGVVEGYLGNDYPYEETNQAYHTVATRDSHHEIYGHWIQKKGSAYIAPSDHLLVDYQDFNCPIAYRFKPSSDKEEGKRMWYQREPERFVDGTKGWETVSIPFKAELVTTSNKGEITHFYEGSTTGHEYWLRVYMHATVDNAKPNVLKATFGKLSENTEDADKIYTNTFLWDYYYSKDDQKDYFEDIYQTYYRDAHTYENYPRVCAGVPYLIGFPGEKYYEFDLSGEWDPDDRYQRKKIVSPGPQAITFASEKGASVGVSDDETGHTTADGYTFRANYLNAPKNTGDAFLLDVDGDSFGKTTDAILGAEAFRPYFVKASASGARNRSIGTAVEKIVFGSDDSKMGMVDNSDPRKGEVGQNLYIYAKDNHIVVESALNRQADIRIINTAGILMRKFTLEPGETREVQMNNGGVFIVKTADGRYRKKLAVK